MELIQLLEIIGTVAFAISGALLAIDKNMDYYGIIISAIINAVGGGIMRDILINQNLPSSLANPQNIIISILTAICVILFYKHVIRLKRMLILADTIGLGAFTAIGTEIAIRNDFNQPLVIITLAILTATGGGMLRDIFAKETPRVFQKEIYAVAALLGATLTIIINRFVSSEVALYACLIFTILIRFICIKKNIHLKKVIKDNITTH